MKLWPLWEFPGFADVENVWCLWDTCAETSFIHTSHLSAAVRENQIEGSAFMDIKCVFKFYYLQPELCLLMDYGVY